jgi:hypothetical protein
MYCIFLRCLAQWKFNLLELLISQVSVWEGGGGGGGKEESYEPL